ncbi:helix-turn-helix transcriptional regulator [Maridesulfovibrio frigidus]|uniref:helix-turn-helix transcriptional regulator n=1 Tax=Maridesulfovibrio frigidus TaxID=340956 RepID=UPI000555D3E9|nr:helix-turn-helix transcriptional regulator [Maridesulfovibrio frigidus]
MKKDIWLNLSPRVIKRIEEGKPNQAGYLAGLVKAQEKLGFPDNLPLMDREEVGRKVLKVAPEIKEILVKDSDGSVDNKLASQRVEYLVIKDHGMEFFPVSRGAGAELTLKELRARTGYSLRKLAELLEVAPSTISKWESGKVSFTCEAAQHVCAVLGLNPEILAYSKRESVFAGAKVKQFMDQRELRIVDLIEQSGLQRTLVDKILRNEQALTESSAEKIAPVLGCATADLFEK